MRPLLTDRQREILNYIEREVRTTGVPSSIRQIGVALGISSTHGVRAHLQALEKKGYIHRSSRTSRGIVSLDRLRRTAARALHEAVAIPILGQVTAGQPILAVENRDGRIGSINGIFTPPPRQRPPQRPPAAATLIPGSCLPPSAPRQPAGAACSKA
jgi:SOS-response transcriptional repressor LexA